ncbi:MAG TPA: class I SAM-dependent DNA methyltransferase [Stellaceae bacterium]|nr:class I SAM-dependent DNA methyltransferase [Stellaceae bacterium]
MTPEEFIAKWRGTELSERAASQSHFRDLCQLLGVPEPTPASAADYTFEKPTRKIGNTQGFADVWKRHCFAWEYKRDRRNLVEAYAQLKGYADALENPPLLIVSDMQEIRVRTNFTNAIAVPHVIPLADLRSVEARDLLRNCFLHPERLRPTATRESVTAEAAANFARIAVALREHHDDRRVAHFINKLVFCLFAEDIDLLPGRVFADILDEAAKRPSDFEPMLRDLFRAMANPHGRFGTVAVPWFNGGLFDDDDVLPLGQNQLRDLTNAARLDWKAIDPTIFGTLFESGLDDKKRAEMASLFDAPEPEHHATLPLHAPAANRGVGIHYTDEATIMKIIEPVVVAPLRREWERIKAEIRELDERRARATAPAQRERLLQQARGLYADFRASLGRYRVLDPACGSGNFLALSLRALKDFDLAVTEDAAAMGLPLDDYQIGPEAVLGIEINAYAAELARLTVWITELQWQLRKGLHVTRRPILDRLDGIQRADALLTPSGGERAWPAADVIVGNPPFLGGKRLRSGLGDAYVERLFAVYAGRVPREADLVAYWFAKAWEQMSSSLSAPGGGEGRGEVGDSTAVADKPTSPSQRSAPGPSLSPLKGGEGKTQRAGLVATNSMRGGANRRVLDRIVREGVIFDAWDDEKWVVEGVAVRVSLICFSGDEDERRPRLDGEPVERISSDLTAAKSDLTRARPLTENKGVAFMGDTKGGAFDIPGDLARRWLQLPLNPNGRPNSDVLRPWVNGMDITRRPSDKWIIDFGWEMSERAAALYEAPFAYCLANVKPDREKNRREAYCRFWWRHVEPRPGMWRALKGLHRFIVTPEVSKHRVFAWLRPSIVPDHKLQVISSEGDFAFGMLVSRIHKSWSLGVGSWHGVGNDPRYTIGTTFETFPFPEGLTPNIPAADYAGDPRAVAIAAAAKRLDELREAWLNPSDLVERVPEVVPGYPDRILPKNPEAAAILKKRTLTNLYNERPAWLDHAHRDLDAAVAAAYGWPADTSDEEALARLLALNLERAAAGR